MSEKDYTRGYAQGMDLFLTDSKSYYAFMETVTEDTNYRRGLEAGMKEARALQIENDYAYKLDQNYKKAYETGYWLMKGDEKAYDTFVKQLKHKDNSVYRGYVAGGKQASMERIQQKLKSLNNGKKRDLDIDFDK